MNLVEGEKVKFLEDSKPLVVYWAINWFREREFNLSGATYRVIGEDDVPGPCTFIEAKSKILNDTFQWIPTGFRRELGTLKCDYCDGETDGNLKFLMRKVIVYKPPPEGSKDLKIHQRGSPTYLFRVTGKIHCPKCGKVQEVNYP